MVRASGHAQAAHLPTWLQLADDLVWTALATGVDGVIAAAAPRQWRRGLLLMHSTNRRLQLLGYSLALEAILQTPEAVCTIGRHLTGDGAPTWCGAA